MTKVLNYHTIILNAFYAKQVDFLKYEDIENYKVLLYQMLNEKYKYIMFEKSLSDIFEIKDHMFIKLHDGIQCIDELDEKFINSCNSIYSKEYQEIINISRDRYKEKIKTKVKKYNK